MNRFFIVLRLLIYRDFSVGDVDADLSNNSKCVFACFN